MKLSDDEWRSMVGLMVQQMMMGHGLTGRFVVVYEVTPEAVSTIGNVSPRERENMLSVVLNVKPESAGTLPEDITLEDIAAKLKQREAH